MQGSRLQLLLKEAALPSSENIATSAAFVKGEQTMTIGDPFPQYQSCYPPSYPPTWTVPAPQLTLRDLMAAACLPAIYAHHTMLTDRAAELAYEQADAMLKVSENESPAALDESKEKP